MKVRGRWKADDIIGMFALFFIVACIASFEAALFIFVFYQPGNVVSKLSAAGGFNLVPAFVMTLIWMARRNNW